MDRRLLVLTGALALAVAAPQTTAAADVGPRTTKKAVAPATQGRDVESGLSRLRADANGKVRVHRSADGAVDFVSSTDGKAMLDAQGTSTPRRTVADQLARYGAAFGIDGTRSRAVVTKTLGSSTGGSVVRSEQVVDGVPVFGGEIVMSLDEDQGVVSVDAATTGATKVAAARVGEARARLAALAATAKLHDTTVAKLTATSKGRKLYDPAIVHNADPLGARPVWQFEVSNSNDVRETVLVGTERGEIALHFNNTPHLDRWICDNENDDSLESDYEVPVCDSPARTEGDAAVAESDVNKAYDNLGATADAYTQLDGIDLTNLIGANVGDGKSLVSTVRWCYADLTCPFPNAFWDGTQMVFGFGYAGADDVVGHELTHGYVERTANLFYLHQSGALNESLADTIGEIVDHRNPASAASDTDWVVGEDLGDPDLTRSMKNPTLSGQPDKMTSPNYVTADGDEDGGAVHANDGVGNKTAYLISQGGTFNGHTITGIDGSDAGLDKTGRLYLETIPRLTSGAEYADLGRVLGTTCDSLVASSTGGFVSSDCVNVREAAAATELASAPTDPKAAAAEAPISCPSGGSVNTVIARDDDGVDGFGFTSPSALWSRAPFGGIPSYAVSGTESLFGLDPDPDLGDDSSGTLSTTSFTVPITSGGTYLNFHHAYVLDYAGTTYYDGGQVIVSRLVNDVWTPVNGLPWTNGATKHIVGNTSAGFTGFGGDSHGYGSSQVNLSSLAGDRVKVDFRLVGDADTAYYGWWIDDVRLYGCDTSDIPPAGDLAPTAPRAAVLKASSTSAVVSWSAPADAGSSPIESYRVTRSDGKVVNLPESARSVTLSGLDAAHTQTVTVEALNADTPGPPATVRAYPTTTKISSSVSKVKKNKAFTITAKVVRSGSTAIIKSMPVVLQRKVSGSSTWSTVSSSKTGTKGTKAWSVKLTKTTAYRVVSKGVTYNFGSISASKTVKKS